MQKMPRNPQYFRSEGHRLIVALGLGPVALGKLAGASKQRAARWLKGSEPEAEIKALLAARRGIPVKAWCASPKAPAQRGPGARRGKVRLTRPTRSGDGPDAPVRAIRALIADVESARAKLPPDKRVAAAKVAANLWVQLARARTLLEVREADVRESDAWHEQEQRILEAVKDCPGAIEAIQREFGGEHVEAQE